MRLAVPVALAVMLAATRALACPSCPTSGQVRCIVLGEGFWSNVGVALLPFLVIGIITYFAHGIGRSTPVV